MATVDDLATVRLGFVTLLADEDRMMIAAMSSLLEMLEDACPRCKQVFDQFDGCCALDCSRCPCSFCAWCLQDCGADAHSHVRECPSNMAPMRDLFVDEAVWREARQLTKVKQAAQLVRGQLMQRGLPFAEALLAKMRPLLVQFGLADLVEAELKGLGSLTLARITDPED